ncbi:hypothetical protein K523DRAFT_358873 [Schizophyllum commune Tattone D]|nr:hypothetical protein K523DRAFT_358873 [Schizophyllum commune Tattone D]
MAMPPEDISVEKSDERIDQIIDELRTAQRSPERHSAIFWIAIAWFASVMVLLFSSFSRIVPPSDVKATGTPVTLYAFCLLLTLSYCNCQA